MTELELETLMLWVIRALAYVLVAWSTDDEIGIPIFIFAIALFFGPGPAIAAWIIILFFAVRANRIRREEAAHTQ
jgi:hypothetical protein